MSSRYPTRLIIDRFYYHHHHWRVGSRRSGRGRVDRSDRVVPSQEQVSFNDVRVVTRITSTSSQPRVFLIKCSVSVLLGVKPQVCCSGVRRHRRKQLLLVVTSRRSRLRCITPPTAVTSAVSTRRYTSTTSARSSAAPVKNRTTISAARADVNNGPVQSTTKSGFTQLNLSLSFDRMM